MPAPFNKLVDLQLKKEMCPGGAGHASGHFKSQCVLCRSTAQLAASPLPVSAPAAQEPWTSTVPGPGDKKKKK